MNTFREYTNKYDNIAFDQHRLPGVALSQGEGTGKIYSNVHKGWRWSSSSARQEAHLCRQGLSVRSLTVGAGSGDLLESVVQSWNTVGVTQDGGKHGDAWMSIRLMECLEKDNGQSRFR